MINIPLLKPSVYFFGGTFTFDNKLVIDVNGSASYNYIYSNPSGSYTTQGFPEQATFTFVKGINCPLLSWLNCDNNPLLTFDVSGSTELTILSVNGCGLTTLDISTNTSMSNLQCANQYLTSLSCPTSLTTLNASNNLFTQFTASATLTVIDLSTNLLTGIKIPSNSALINLTISSNKISGSFTVSGSISGVLFCNANAITSLSASNTSLTTIDASSNKLTGIQVPSTLDGLNISDNNLTSFTLLSHGIQSLNISYNTSLMLLSFYYNTSNTSIDVTGNTSMIYINISGNSSLTTIDGLSDLTSLDTLAIGGSNISEITIPSTVCMYIDINSTPIVQFSYNNNSIMDEFYFTNCSSMTDLDISNELITSLDFSGCTALVNINVSGNSLGSLNVSQTSVLDTLNCSGCSLTSLTMDVTSMLYFNASNNALNITTVDDILSAIDGNGLSTGTIDLSGGTNGVPTDGNSNTNKLSLEGKGWTVTINT